MPFEDELSDALRRAGDDFTTDERALVDAGERRGRRLVARRRIAVVGGSVLALAAVGVGGFYSGGLFGGVGGGKGGGGSQEVNVAAPPVLPSPAHVSGEQLVGVLKQLLPGGTVSQTEARGTGEKPGPMVYGVYDDGKGKAAISVGLSRVDPDGPSAADALTCPDKNLQEYDSCTVGTLTDGAKLHVYQGYEYPDRREPTKRWRAALMTAAGFRVEVQEWNAPAEKGSPVSRETPPLTVAQLKDFVTSPLWHPALNALPAAQKEQRAQPPSAEEGGGVPGGVGAVLESLLPKSGITVVSKGGEGEYGYLVLDDGKGKSMVQINVQSRMGDLLDGPFSGSEVTVMPDGTRVRAEQRPGEKGGAGVVWWTVDTLRPDGRRVVVSAFNAADQNKAATRAKPILTMEQLKGIALDPQWNR